MMEWLSPDTLKAVLAIIGASTAAYGGIRADLRAVRERAESAHDRLDRHLEGHP